MPLYDANIYLILRVYLVTFILHCLGRVQGREDMDRMIA